MKPLLALLMAALASVGVGACGGAAKDLSRQAQAPTVATSVPQEPPVVASTGRAPRGLKGDEDDDDEPGENNGKIRDPYDADFDNDTKKEHKGYSDSDDREVLTFGHQASPAEARTLGDIVHSYYVAAAADDGARACAMLVSTIAQSIPEDYGGGNAPAYLRGKTCARVMSRLFQHMHGQIDARSQITDVRVKGNQALVLVGSRTVPASYVTLEERDGAWKFEGLSGVTLP